MFIRWHITDPVDPRYKRMRALLIESVRVDGKPRQRHLAFLGSVTYQDRNDVEERWQFWRNADQALYRLGNRLSPIQRGEVEKALAERIRPLTPSQIEACEKREQARELERQEAMRESLELVRSFKEPTLLERMLLFLPKLTRTELRQLRARIDQQTGG
jgi:hypothetical protein